MRIQRDLTNVYESVTQMRDVRTQLKDLRERLPETPPAKRIVSAAEDLDKKIGTVQDELVDFRITSTRSSNFWFRSNRTKSVSVNFSLQPISHAGSTKSGDGISDNTSPAPREASGATNSVRCGSNGGASNRLANSRIVLSKNLRAAPAGIDQ